MAVTTTIANSSSMPLSGGIFTGPVSFSAASAASDYTLNRTGTTGSLTVAGAASAGASITLYAGSHATRADEIRMLQGAALVLQVAAAGVCKFGESGQFPIHNFNTNTTTSVGAAGGATALPATPTGYWRVEINGTERRIPYYAT